MTMNPGEQLFSDYARRRGYTCVFEPARNGYFDDIATQRNPDFLITVDGVPVLCEVKAPDDALDVEMFRASDKLRAGEGVIVPSRNRTAAWWSIRDACDQLKPFKGRGIPLVAVIVDLNPEGLGFAFEREDIEAVLGGEIAWAVDSNWTVSVERRTSPIMTADRRVYLAGAVWLTRHSGRSDEFAEVIVDNPWRRDDYPPLPPAAFAGPATRRIVLPDDAEVEARRQVVQVEINRARGIEPAQHQARRSSLCPIAGPKSTDRPLCGVH